MWFLENEWKGGLFNNLIEFIAIMAKETSVYVLIQNNWIDSKFYFYNYFLSPTHLLSPAKKYRCWSCRLLENWNLSNLSVNNPIYCIGPVQIIISGIILVVL